MRFEAIWNYFVISRQRARKLNVQRTARRFERGMTLLEIMVVLVIIAMVGSIVTVGALNVKSNADKKAALVQIQNLVQALEMYKLDNRRFPSTSEGLGALVTPKNGGSPYIKSLPADPWGNEFVYIFPGTATPGSFDLISYGPDGVQGGGDDITSSDSPEAAKK